MSGRQLWWWRLLDHMKTNSYRYIRWNQVRTMLTAMKLKFGIMLWQNLVRNPDVRKPCPEKQGSILASNRAFQIPVTFYLMKNPSSVPQCAAPGTPSYHLLSPPAVLDLLQWQETTFFFIPTKSLGTEGSMEWNEVHTRDLSYQWATSNHLCSEI